MHKTLEGELTDEQVCGLLISSAGSCGRQSGAVPLRLLDAPGGRGGLAGRSGGKLLAGNLPSVDLSAVCLVSMSHFDDDVVVTTGLWDCECVLMEDEY